MSQAELSEELDRRSFPAVADVNGPAHRPEGALR